MLSEPGYFDAQARSIGYRSFSAMILSVGLVWRRVTEEDFLKPLAEKRIPDLIELWWNEVFGNGKVHLEELKGNRELSFAVCSLMACSDSASEGFGFATKVLLDEVGNESACWLWSLELLRDYQTLTYNVNRSKCIVFPKAHVPNSGFTLRSLSQNLSYLRPCEVEPRWNFVPCGDLSNKTKPFNVLVLPWPLHIPNQSFSPVPSDEIAEGFSYLDFDLIDPSEVIENWFKKCLSKVRDLGIKIDLIVLPELSLTEQQFDQIKTLCETGGIHVLAGVSQKINGRKFNMLKWFGGATTIVQHKHHRWRIDRRQVVKYELSGVVSADQVWWENTDLVPRQINFAVLANDVVVCPLICEDLARQDPVAEIVRRVGPSLVIAILMDGPQRMDRWSAQYAGVLADDPGSSVLTVTSLGMVRRNGEHASASICLWRDQLNQPKTIELSNDETAVVLSLGFQGSKEFSADGRAVDGVLFPILHNTYHLRVPLEN